MYRAFVSSIFYNSLCSNAGKEDTVIQQLSLFSDNPPADSRPPITITWNGIHGCTKVSYGCQHCYMFRRDESVGKDPTIVRKTQSFKLPVRRLRTGKHKGLYKIPSGSHIYTCFSSDFFHKDADAWRDEMWDMIRERSDCTFFMITKRPERILDHLPAAWDGGWDHVSVSPANRNRQVCPTWEEMCEVKEIFWEDEEEVTDERIDPMEYAGEQEAPEGGPSLDLEVSDVVEE